MLRILRDNPDKKVCLLCVDPTRKRTGGALLGDRIRMNSLSNNNLYMRSLASRGSGSEISANLDRAIEAAKAVGFDLISVKPAVSAKAAMRLPRIRPFAVCDDSRVRCTHST